MPKSPKAFRLKFCINFTYILLIHFIFILVFAVGGDGVKPVTFSYFMCLMSKYIFLIFVILKLISVKQLKMCRDFKFTGITLNLLSGEFLEKTEK
jgi:hypothetical protein